MSAFTLLGRFKKKNKKKIGNLMFWLHFSLSALTHHSNLRTIWNFSLSQKFFLSFCSNPTYEISLKISSRNLKAKPWRFVFFLFIVTQKNSKNPNICLVFLSSRNPKNPNFCLVFLSSRKPKSRDANLFLSHKPSRIARFMWPKMEKIVNSQLHGVDSRTWGVVSALSFSL